LLFLLTLFLCSALSKPLEQYRLISLEEGKPPVRMTQQEAFALRAKGVHFMDVTAYPNKWKRTLEKKQRVAFPTVPTQQTVVYPLLDMLNASSIYNTLNTLSSWQNRFYTSTHGATSAQWIAAHMEVSAGSRLDYDIVVDTISHVGFDQPSVIGKILGSTYPDVRIIIGAHEDSVNWNQTNQNENRAPGADDDGSGTVAVLEIFEALAHSSFRPRCTLEFQTYAGEEVGLYGSQDIAEGYLRLEVPVYGYYNLDMIGYAGSLNNTFAMQVFTDYTDPDLSAFVKQLFSAYSSVTTVDGTCGYACSDHASWDQAGYSTAFVLHQANYPYGHAQSDTINYVNCDLIKETANTALAFLVELDFAYGLEMEKINNK